MARAIDSEAAYRFLSEQLVKETGAFSKGVNKGLNIARSAMRNPDAISALRPVSREKVEKAWRGEWKITYDEGKEKTIVVCSKCGEETVYDFILESDELVDFCPVCGAPMTDEAVDILWHRWKEAIENA